MNAIIYHWEKPEPFFIEFGETYLHGDLLPSEAVKLPEILFLHGAQGPGRREFLLLRQVLWEHFSLSSCAFDFIGYGTTGGKLRPLSLQERRLQARDIINACFDLQPFSIVTTDANIEIAVSLADFFQLRYLLLLNSETMKINATELPVKIVEIPLSPESNLISSINHKPASLAKVASLIHAVLRQQ